MGKEQIQPDEGPETGDDVYPAQKARELEKSRRGLPRRIIERFLKKPPYEHEE